MYKYKTHLLVFFSFLLSCALLFGTSKVNVALLLAPVDFEHDMIAHAIDEGLLDEIEITDENGVLRSLNELNREITKELEEQIDSGHYQKVIEFFKAYSLVKEKRLGVGIADRAGLLGETGYNKKGEFIFVEKERIKKIYRNGLLKVLFSLKFRKNVRLIGKYINGTHIAGIALKGLKDVDLISFPLKVYPTEFRLGSKTDPDEIRRRTRQSFEEITKVLKQKNIKVVNLPRSADSNTFKAKIMDEFGLFKTLIFWTKISERADKIAKVMKEEMETFFQDNPETVFILSAGSPSVGENIDKMAVSSSHIVADNVIKVAAASGGFVSTVANFSGEHVDLAAPGTAINSALSGGGEARFSGSDMASAEFTNKVAKVLELDPSLTAKEAVDHVMKLLVHETSYLRDQVKDNKLLIEDEGYFKDSLEDLAPDEVLEIDIEDITVKKMKALLMDYAEMTLDPRIDSREEGEYVKEHGKKDVSTLDLVIRQKENPSYILRLSRHYRIYGGYGMELLPLSVHENMSCRVFLSKIK